MIGEDEAHRSPEEEEGKEGFETSVSHPSTLQKRQSMTNRTSQLTPRRAHFSPTFHLCAWVCGTCGLRRVALPRLAGHAALVAMLSEHDERISKDDSTKNLPQGSIFEQRVHFGNT